MTKKWHGMFWPGKVCLDMTEKLLTGTLSKPRGKLGELFTFRFMYFSATSITAKICYYPIIFQRKNRCKNINKVEVEVDFVG